MRGLVDKIMGFTQRTLRSDSIDGALLAIYRQSQVSRTSYAIATKKIRRGQTLCAERR